MTHKWRAVAWVCILLCLLGGCASREDGNTVQTEGAAPDAEPPTEELRGVWISYYELAEMLVDKTEKQCKAALDAALQNCKDMGLTDVFMHVRAYGDAFYKSDFFPWSKYAGGKEGEAPSIDPLAYAVERAHALGLRLHAWINPYRAANTTDLTALSEGHPARRYYDEGWVRSADGKLYFDPASEKARQLVCDGVREILQNYAVDGIHFDDYFYPTTDAAFDAPAFAATGAEQIDDWRRAQVNLLVQRVWQTVKNTKENVVFGISPSYDIDKNYQSYYADVAMWAKTYGYVDYLCPQLYFGYEHEVEGARFPTSLAAWENLERTPSVRLYLGLAAYKINTDDGGSDEWRTVADLLARQVADMRKNAYSDGVVFYNYSSLFSTAADAQRHALQQVFAQQ